MTPFSVLSSKKTRWSVGITVSISPDKSCPGRFADNPRRISGLNFPLSPSSPTLVYIHFFLAMMEPPYLCHSPLLLCLFQGSWEHMRQPLLVTNKVQFPFCFCLCLPYSFPRDLSSVNCTHYNHPPLVSPFFPVLFANWLLLESSDISQSLTFSCSLSIVYPDLLATWLFSDILDLSRSLTFSLPTVGGGRAAR